MTAVSNVHSKPVHTAPPPERQPPKAAERKEPEVRKAPPPERGRNVDKSA